MRSTVNIITGAILAFSGLTTIFVPVIFMIVIPIAFFPLLQMTSSDGGSSFNLLFIGIGLIILISLLGVVLIGLAMTLGGGFMVFLGIRGLKKGSADKQALDREGVNTQGNVTFVDRNYSILINNQPVYSIVEYHFRDFMGRDFTGRKEDVQSELVIRNKIEVGSQVTVRYVARNPLQNTLLLTDPRLSPR